LSLLWDDQKFETSSANTRTIDVHVGVIKKKLSKIKGFRIDTVYGVGYRLLLTRRV
jgi:DNA-binding response OmpR family regulator